MTSPQLSPVSIVHLGFFVTLARMETLEKVPGVCGMLTVDEVELTVAHFTKKSCIVPLLHLK